MFEDLRAAFDAMMSELETRAHRLDEEDRLAVACQVFKALVMHAREGGTYRYLIYDRLGFGPEAYAPLQLAGALQVSNTFVLSDTTDEEPHALLELRRRAEAAPMENHPNLHRSNGEPLKVPSDERTALFRAVHLIERLLEERAMLQAANSRLAVRVEELEHPPIGTINPGPLP